MSSAIHFDKAGIFLSKPIALLVVIIYLAQAILLISLVRDKYELQRIIDYQRQRIAEMEEKLKILQVIEDFQIGFTDEEKRELAGVIFDESAKYGYDPFLIMAVILTESSFTRGQVSENGAMGVMQLLPSVGTDLASRSGFGAVEPMALFDPVVNVRLGTLHLFEQILKFHDVKKGIIAYNVGETRVRERIRDKQPLPGRFFQTIWRNYTMLKEKYDI